MSELDHYLAEDGTPGIFTRLARLGLLVESFQRGCLDEFDLSFVEFSVLRVLQLVGPPHQSTPTELSGYLFRSSGGVTQIVDRLVARKLVERFTNPSNRRQVLVQLTAGGSRLATRAQAKYERERSRVLGALDDDEIVQIDQALRRMLVVLGDEPGFGPPASTRSEGRRTRPLVAAGREAPVAPSA